MKHNILTSNTSKEDLFRKYSNPLLERAYKKAKGLLVEEDGVLLEEDGKPEGDEEGRKPELPAALDKDKYLELKDIQCFYPDDSIMFDFESVHVMKDVERKADGSYKKDVPYNWIADFEKKGLVLPPMPVTMAIVERLFLTGVKKVGGKYVTLDEKARSVLDQYKNYATGSNDWGYHCQNTLFHYDKNNSKIIHIPQDKHFSDQYKGKKVNKSMKTLELDFDPASLCDSTLEEALRNDNGLKFVKLATGLKDPMFLLELAEYFEKTAKLWFPFNGKYNDYKGTQAGWFGCGSDGLSISTDSDLDGGDGARGVQLFPR